MACALIRLGSRSASLRPWEPSLSRLLGSEVGSGAEKNQIENLDWLVVA